MQLAIMLLSMLCLMILSINDNKFIIDLQEKFSECFPYLRIQFYSKPCLAPRVPSVHDLLPGDLRVGDIRTLHDPGLLDIKSYYKTGKIEADFENLFGLHVQVLRKENHRWMRTSNTKNLTLQQQSQIAQATERVTYRQKELA